MENIKHYSKIQLHQYVQNLHGINEFKMHWIHKRKKQLITFTKRNPWRLKTERKIWKLNTRKKSENWETRKTWSSERHNENPENCTPLYEDKDDTIILGVNTGGFPEKLINKIENWKGKMKTEEMKKIWKGFGLICSKNILQSKFNSVSSKGMVKIDDTTLHRIPQSNNACSKRTRTSVHSETNVLHWLSLR